MPPTDRGGRGYSDRYVATVRKELLDHYDSFVKEALGLSSEEPSSGT